ncbi:MAG TPA: bifunctional ornithine acetyltransferase/N-acetylglutamate synthase [Streptosporangiaceae bacterium]|nr:bifunctional ornithine acetyltransferase/N-acetylglutamate synthase [Streptosporangiaceae bacterium]
MSVTAPIGFRAAGVAAGLKSGGRDVAVVVNDGPSRAAAAVFTSNRVKAAPVRWTQQVLRGGRVRAVVLNSGGANACTGAVGFQDTHATAERLAAALDDSAGEIAVCSTGLIGERLAMEALLPGVDAAVAALSRAGGLAAADAIRTTDTVVKIAFRKSGAAPAAGAAQVRAGAGAAGAGAARASEASAGAASRYTVGGMAKGAGMLAPALATMLCVLTTDADLDASGLDSALRAAVAHTFDRVDTDGCMSTNDTVVLLASGASGVRPDPAEFTSVVTAVCADLARQLVADAEGSTKTVAVEAIGAASEADALTAARAVARSSLLKCALAGEDPNWGRVVAAVGTTDAAFEPDRLNVAINGVWVCRAGCAGDDRSKADLRTRDVTITVDLSAGLHAATVWTTDLTAAYVHENSAYPT